MQLLAILIANRTVPSRFDAVVERLHVLAVEGRLQCAHLLEHDAQRPDVALGVVGFVGPDFGRAVVRRARLRPRQALFLQLGHVQVADFGLLAFGKKYVGALDVPVQHLHFVQVAESFEYVGDLFPYFIFGKHCACFLASIDPPTQVSVFTEVLNDVQIA